MYRQAHFQIAFLDFYRNVHTYDLQAPDVQEFLTCYRFVVSEAYSIDFSKLDALKKK